MSKNAMSILIIVLSVAGLFLFLFLLILLIRFMKRSRLVIEEQIDTDIYQNKIHYLISIRNSKGKETYIKNYGLVVYPYHIPLAHPSYTEEGSIEIAPHAELVIDLSSYISSRFLKEKKGNIYFYYEDAFSMNHMKKAKLWKKYLELQNKN